MTTPPTRAALWLLKQRRAQELARRLGLSKQTGEQR